MQVDTRRFGCVREDVRRVKARRGDGVMSLGGGKCALGSRIQEDLYSFRLLACLTSQQPQSQTHMSEDTIALEKTRADVGAPKR